MVTFAVEQYRDLIDEMKPLFVQHKDELAVYSDIPLDPDYDFYGKAADAGLLTFLTMRDEGVLAGYAVFIVRPHAHYKGHRWALNDIIWVHPQFRGFRLGRAFVGFWDRHFADTGVNVVHVNTKVSHLALGHVLKQAGYKTVEEGHEKRLG
jgi:GNAT superfamily N-acetyltransferase